ncbi:MAG TPA: hypothetical protein VGE64_01165 [Xanthomonadaceae bacterium]
MTPASVFDALGLPPDADERAIKRAYAAKLRITRPDVDPEGFQQLNEAYQAALALLQHRLAREAMTTDESVADSAEDVLGESRASVATDLAAPQEDADHDIAEAGTSGTIDGESGHEDAADAPQGEAITLDQFLDQCLGAASDGDPRVLEHWLRSQPVLWSLEHKAMIGHWLLRLMDARQPPMTERNFDMLAEFFGYNDLHAGYDPLALQRLRARLIESWRELQAQRRWQRPTGESLPSSAYSFASIAQGPASNEQAPSQGAQRDEQAELLRRKQAWRQRLVDQFAHLVDAPNRLRDLRLVINPLHAPAVKRFLMRNPFGGLNDLPSDIRRDQIAFWLSMADDRRWPLRRIKVALLRSAAFTLPTLPIILMVNVIDASSDGPQASAMIAATIATALQVFVALMACWFGIAAFKAWLYWQAGHAADTLKRVAQHAAVPALVVTSMAGMFVGSPSMLTFVSGTLAGWTSLFQFRARLFEQRHGSPLDASDGFIALLSGLTLLHAAFYFGNSSNEQNGLWAILTWVLSLVMWAVGTLGKRRT